MDTGRETRCASKLWFVRRIASRGAELSGRMGRSQGSLRQSTATQAPGTAPMPSRLSFPLPAVRRHRTRAGDGMNRRQVGWGWISGAVDCCEGADRVRDYGASDVRRGAGWCRETPLLRFLRLSEGLNLRNRFLPRLGGEGERAEHPLISRASLPLRERKQILGLSPSLSPGNRK